MQHPRSNVTPPINPPVADKSFSQVFLVDVSSTGKVSTFDFLDHSIAYFDYQISQSFQYVLIDNRGKGDIRVSYNRPSIDMSSPVDGAKTIGSGESLYIEDDIWHLDIYYVGSSYTEIILKSTANRGDQP